MANQNLFEKYGIKEVADVTFYRIERKTETYESQREIELSSVLKGALETQTVYPMVGGAGEEEGFEAYVFSDADVLTGKNYDCDDSMTVTETFTFTHTSNSETKLSTVKYDDLTKDNDAFDVIKRVIIDPELGKVISTDSLDGYTATATFKSIASFGDTVVNESGSLSGDATYTTTYKAVFSVIYNNASEAGSPDAAKTPGTHEYSYEEQILMLFAKNQNLIDKTGVRYQFKNADTIFGNLSFNDNFAAAPNSSEKVVVVGITGRFTASGYDMDEVKAEIANLTDSFKAKAYNVNYADYAELVVEDEMGYYNNFYLANGESYRRTGGTASVKFFKDSNAYIEYAEANNGVDYALASATMWGDSEHDSINDAIDALKQKKRILDAGAESAVSGINSVYGGYKVQTGAPTPAAGKDDLANEYTFKVGETSIAKATSQYALSSVLEKLAFIANNHSEEVTGKDLEVVQGAETSNRAIYVGTDGSVDTSAGAYIYLLKNKNAKKLTTDKDGIFQFEDKKGNTLLYQDKIFAGVEALALVIIGTKGLIFVVNRYGTRNIEKIAWMVNENGYISNSQAKTLISNGLIHTVDVTILDETFEATCTVNGLSVRKVEKKVNRYVPVLFLDTLKVSTIEQSAETTYANGGRGNANLIGWDFNKQITLTLQDALYTPASMSAMLGSYEGNDFTKGVKDTKKIDRTEKCIAKRSFIVPAGNHKGVPSEADNSPQAVYLEIATMQPYQDGAPIAEGEVYLKWTRSVAYNDNSLGTTIEISADKFPGTYKIVGDTFARNAETGEDQRFQFIIPKAKVSPETMTITLEAEGDPAVFDMTLTVLRPEDGLMMKLVQYDVVENTEENDGSTMVKDTENLNLLDDAEMFKVSADEAEEKFSIGATEY